MNIFDVCEGQKFRNGGPVIHRLFFKNSSNFMPFDPSSAQFASVLTYLHSLRDDSFSITVNRFDSYVWNCLDSL